MRSLSQLVCMLSVTLVASGGEPPTPGKWHFSGVTEVRAYRLNWEDKHSSKRILSRDGSLNPSRLPERGIRLNEGQVARLRAAVTGRHPNHPVAGCFYPHHAFVFYDESGKVIGYIDICFLCANYSGKPPGYARSWDLGALVKLIEDIGMPLRNPKWD